MPEIEQNFRKLMVKIGIAMLIFVGAINTLVFLDEMVNLVLFVAYEDSVFYTVASQILYFFIYALSFLIPAISLIAMTKNDRQPLIKGLALPKETALYVVAGIAVILAFAYINSIFMSPFQMNDILTEENWQTAYDEPYEVVLHLLTVAVAPGIFEEFLFRGVMLAKLRPYGKTPAILISALMFSLMHQNQAQFLYAFVAGILLGWVATETGSLLCCILIHFSNNAFSVLEQTALANMTEETYSLIFYPIEILIFVIGIVCFAILAFSHFKKKKKNENNFSGGMFGRELVLQTDGGDFAVPAKKAVKLFFSPSVIVFICVALFESVLILLLGLLGAYLA